MKLFCEIQQRLDKLGRPRTKKVWHLQCDNCQQQFIGFPKTKTGLHFHSRKCMQISSREGGQLFEFKKKTNLENWGVENVFQSDEIQLRRETTLQQNLGVSHPQQSKLIRDKTSTTNTKLYGAKTPLTKPGMASILGKRAQTAKSKLKRENTTISRYGFKHVSQSPEVAARQARNRQRASILVHWKTGEELVCVASYEIAFIRWCNINQVDFDWQIPFVTPLLTPAGRNSVYIIDAFIKSGEFANTWIEVKGYFRGGDDSRKKWDWFHSTFTNSQLWNEPRLREVGVL